MWQKIIIGVLLAVSVFYLGRRIFKTAVKGEEGECADCPPKHVKNSVPEK